MTGDSRVFSFVQAGKIGTVQTQVEIRDAHGLVRAHGINVPGLALHKRWLGRQNQIKVFQVDGQGVDNRKLAQDRHGVLKVGQVQPSAKVDAMFKQARGTSGATCVTGVTAARDNGLTSFIFGPSGVKHRSCFVQTCAYFPKWLGRRGQFVTI